MLKFMRLLGRIIIHDGVDLNVITLVPVSDIIIFLLNIEKLVTFFM